MNGGRKVRVAQHSPSARSVPIRRVESPPFECRSSLGQSKHCRHEHDRRCGRPFESGNSDCDQANMTVQNCASIRLVWYLASARSPGARDSRAAAQRPANRLGARWKGRLGLLRPASSRCPVSRCSAAKRATPAFELSVLAANIRATCWRIVAIDSRSTTRHVSSSMMRRSGRSSDCHSAERLTPSPWQFPDGRCPSSCTLIWVIDGPWPIGPDPSFSSMANCQLAFIP